MMLRSVSDQTSKVLSADESRLLLREMMTPVRRDDVIGDLRRMSERMASPRFQRSMGLAG